MLHSALESVPLLDRAADSLPSAGPTPYSDPGLASFVGPCMHLLVRESQYIERTLFGVTTNEHES
ncbi:MAG: hypothetical protein AB1938_05165 [Myxococcota bacterium]